MEIPPKSDEETTKPDDASSESADSKRRPRPRSRLYRTTKGVKTISTTDVAGREAPAPAPAPEAVREAPPAESAGAHADHEGDPGQPQGGEGNNDEGGGYYQQHGGGKFGRRHRGKISAAAASGLTPISRVPSPRRNRGRRRKSSTTVNCRIRRASRTWTRSSSSPPTFPTARRTLSG